MGNPTYEYAKPNLEQMMEKADAALYSLEMMPLRRVGAIKRI